MTLLLQRQFVEVRADGVLVVLSIGTQSWTLEFDLALMIAAVLLVKGRRARRIAGDGFLRRRCMGVLHDADAKPTRRSRFARVLAERLKARDVAVTDAGNSVNLRIGPTTAGLPWDFALQLSQWLRIRGREAKLAAGERAHWSVIGNLAAAEAGERPW